MATTDDRRKFLKQSGAALGGFLINPAAGLLGLMAAGAATSQKEFSKERGDKTADSWRSILRTGAPINSVGHAFGGRLSSLHSFQMPEALQKNETGGRYVVVATHASPPIGISTFEVAKTKRGWDHVVAGRSNRIFSIQSPVALDGARLKSGPLFRHQTLVAGVGRISCASATPWNTVLCAESASSEGQDFGWVVEINPLNGVVVKRFSLGRTEPLGLLTVAESARRYVVYMLGGPSVEQIYLYKFVSHQRFDAMRFDVNSQLLVIGELSVARIDSAPEKNHEWISLTAGLSNDDWLRVMQSPAEAAAQVGSSVAGAHALVRDAGALVLVCDTEIIRLTEKGGAWESTSFSVELEAGSPEKFSSARLKPRSFVLRAEDSSGGALVLGVEHEGDAAIISVSV